MHPTLVYATALCAVGVHAAGLPTLMTGRSIRDVTNIASLRYRTIGPAPAPVSFPQKRQRADGRCGKNFGGSSCYSDECCSAEGWCGQGYDYCSAPACQINYGPYCDANRRPSGGETENTPRTYKGSVPYGEGIYHCEKTGGIALTFDDGPFEYTGDLLDILGNYGAKATFFITGNNLGKGAINDPQYPWRNLVKRMINEGHQIASHTWAHQRLTELTQTQLRTQMIYNEIAIADIIGKFPTYMRPPYSASNDNTDSWLGDLGYHVTYFNLDTEGYLHDDASQIQVSKDIWDTNVEGQDPSDIHFLQIEHDTEYQTVYNLTEYILKSMKRNGLKTYTVGECLNDSPDNWYRTPSGGGKTSTSKRSTSTSTSANPGPSLPPTKDGRCGSSFGGATCAVEPGATCCSQYGWCGNTVDHCGTGCQQKYGTCGKSN
ncbi:Chitin deacetylase [Cladobotryum mycophilum]|uniref:Chitin deacetylase n=1 Tax=Cladobotryum mycophilum TaxID=491253 RepID=A0ABR0SIE6_9HYPO